MCALIINDAQSHLSEKLIKKMQFITNKIIKDEANIGESVNLKIVSTEEITELNSLYRGKNKPTNVLSFTNKDVSKEHTKSLGDIAINFEYVENEAIEQQKLLNDHLIHMLVHGLYHILGYDHENKSDALVMESKEISRLKELDIQNPYL
mgnify:CR=1 FL=1